jgi:cytochrome c biogenesis protein
MKLVEISGFIHIDLCLSKHWVHHINDNNASPGNPLDNYQSNFVSSVWNFSVPETNHFLLIGLAVASIIGTVVQQNASHEQYLKEYSEATIRLFSALNFFDMYHSWWFILLLYLLTVNLIACSIKRLPRDLKMVSTPTLILNEGLEKSLSCVEHHKMTGNAATLTDKMAAFLRQEFAAPQITEDKGVYHLFAQKNLYSRFGVYFLHFSIIVIFIWAMIGSFFGYKAYVSIEEGNGISEVYKRPAVGELMETPEQLAKRTINLGFTVRCDKFSVSFYDNGAPKEFKSILSVIENGKTVIDRRPIIVNDPLTYKGITFYQASYSPAGEPVFHLTAKNRKDNTQTKLAIRQGDRIALPGGAYLQALEYTQEIKPFIPQLSGPALKVAIIPKTGEPQSFLLLRNYPDFDAERGGDLIFTYDSIDEKWQTGLQVAKDPGVWIVWAGCALMVIGICMAFFLSHRRVWVRVESGRITIGGTSNKNQAAFQLFFDSLLEKLGKT